MSRPLRVEYEHAAYHVTARGNERRRIFRSDTDRELFLQTLAQTVALHELVVHGFCLMPNHYHLLVETPRGNLSQATGWLQATYTMRFNRRHRRSGDWRRWCGANRIGDVPIWARVILGGQRLTEVARAR